MTKAGDVMFQPKATANAKALKQKHAQQFGATNKINVKKVESQQEGEWFEVRLIKEAEWLVDHWAA